MKHLFVCSTPLQLIHIINLKLNKLSHDEVTLYILDHNQLYEDMYKKAIETNLFKKVYLLKTSEYNRWSRSERNRFTRYMVKILEYLFYKTISKHFVKDQILYDKFWISHMDQSSWLLFMMNKKRNKYLELIFFEDGTGGYLLLNRKQNPIEIKLLHLLGYKSLYEEIKMLYLYKPTLVADSLYPNVKLEELPKIDNICTKNALNKLFLVDKSDIENSNYLYLFFDSPFLSEDISRKQSEMVSFLSEKLKDEFRVKLHPRSKLSKDSIENLLLNIQMPTEIISLNRDVSQNVFISIFSTVGISPKLMFDQEPILIFLYKIINVDMFVGREAFEFIERFAKIYTNTNKIFIPETFQELENILRTLEASDNSIKDLNE